MTLRRDRSEISKGISAIEIELSMEEQWDHPKIRKRKDCPRGIHRWQDR